MDLTRGTSDRIGFTPFISACNHISTNRQTGAIGRKLIYMKNLFTLRCLFICLLVPLSMAMRAERIGEFRYDLDAETQTATLSGYDGSATEVVIPESVIYNGVTYSVTSLGYRCFCNYSPLESITIPSSVTSLGDGCFLYCSSLTSITIPSSMTSLRGSCFRECI